MYHAISLHNHVSSLHLRQESNPSQPTTNKLLSCPSCQSNISDVLHLMPTSLFLPCILLKNTSHPSWLYPPLARILVLTRISIDFLCIFHYADYTYFSLTIFRRCIAGRIPSLVGWFTNDWMQLERNWLWPISYIPTFVWKGWGKPREISGQSMYLSSFEWGNPLIQFQGDVTCSGAILKVNIFFSSPDVFLSNLCRCKGLLLHLETVSDTHTHTQTHTHTHTVGLLWTSDQPVVDTSTWQHTTLTTERHTFPRRNSNPQSQQASGRRPTP